MIKLYSSQFVIFLFSVFGICLSNDPVILKLKSQLERLAIQFPQEKIYLHSDRSVYIAGEDIWLKVYLFDAKSLLLTEISSVAYVELIDEHKNILFKKDIFIKDGSGNGDIKLDFFPEGGELIDGIASKVGFKIIDQSSGNGIPTSGKILNQKGETVAYLKTIKFGLGLFNIKPEASQKYTAEIEFKSRIYKFPLPSILSKGYVMQVLNRDVDNLSIQISTNVGDKINGLYLVGKMRGELFYAGKIDAKSNFAKTKISKDSLPDGIAQITLFSAKGEPLCERLVFIERPENKLMVSIFSKKSIYDLKEKVSVKITVKDFQDNLTQGDLSVSVFKSDFSSQQYSENIKSWMLLNSDLKGKVEQPGFYFSNKKKSTKQLLDILMMTQGWRRFTWKQMEQEDFPKIKYLPEIGFNIKGYVTKQESDKREVSNVYLSVMNEQLQFEEIETDAMGNFFFPNLHFFDSTTLILQARKPFSNHEKQKKKKKNEGKLLGSKLLDIHLEKNEYQEVSTLAKSSNNIFTENQVEGYLNQYERIGYEKQSFDGWDIELSDVVVKAKKKRKNMTPLEKLDNSVKDLNRRYILDSLVYVPKSVLQILRDNPRVEVSGPPFQETVNLPIVLDDVPINKELQMSLIHALNSEQGYLVDVYDFMTNYHSNGSLGPGIVIYTRAYLGKGSSKGKGIVNFIHPVYYKAREFYSPDYDDKPYNKNQPDYRNTLYWNPKLKGSSNGFSFFTCEEIGNYDIIVEGMTKTGIPVFGKYQITVE